MFTNLAILNEGPTVYDSMTIYKHIYIYIESYYHYYILLLLWNYVILYESIENPKSQNNIYILSLLNPYYYSITPYESIENPFKKTQLLIQVVNLTTALHRLASVSLATKKAAIDLPCARRWSSVIRRSI